MASFETISLDEDRIRRKFTTFGVVIEHLLALEPIPIDLVKKKLIQLELALDTQVLCERQYAKLATEWRRKIAQFWEVYTEALMSPANGSEMPRLLAPISSGFGTRLRKETLCLMPPPLPQTQKEDEEKQQQQQQQQPVESLTSMARNRSLESVLELFCPLSNESVIPPSNELISLSGDAAKSSRSSPARVEQDGETCDTEVKLLPPPLLSQQEKDKYGIRCSPSDMSRSSEVVKKPSTESSQQQASTSRSPEPLLASKSVVIDDASNSLSEMSTTTSSNATSPDMVLEPQKAIPEEGKVGTAASFRFGCTSASNTPPLQPRSVAANVAGPWRMAKYRANPMNSSRYWMHQSALAAQVPPRRSINNLPVGRFSNDILAIASTATVPALRAHIERHFANFQPIIRVTDLGPFRKLTMLTAKAARLVLNTAHCEYTELQAKVFEQVFAKLPVEKQEMYEKLHHKKSLKKLLLFLCNHVSSLQRANGGRRPTMPQIEDRPICFKCFQYGHLLAACRNGPLLSSSWIDFESIGEDDTSQPSSLQKVLVVDKPPTEEYLDSAGYYSFEDF